MLKYVSCLWQLKNVTKSSSRNDTLGVTEVRGQVRQTCFPSGMINFHNMRFNTSHFSSRWSDSSSNRISSLTSTKIFLLCLKDFFFSICNLRGKMQITKLYVQPYENWDWSEKKFIKTNPLPSGRNSWNYTFYNTVTQKGVVRSKRKLSKSYLVIVYAIDGLKLNQLEPCSLTYPPTNAQEILFLGAKSPVRKFGRCFEHWRYWSSIFIQYLFNCLSVMSFQNTPPIAENVQLMALRTALVLPISAQVT